MTGKTIHVLLVEDNPGDVRIVREALAGTVNPAFELEHAERLSSGLARLASGGIDVLLLDLGLPDSQGLEGLAQVHRLSPALPVVVLSGAADEQFAVEAVQSGAQDYLVKDHAKCHILTRSLRYAIERKRGDEALRESEERLRLAMDAANEAIWEYRPDSGVVRWNETFTRNFGRPPVSGSVLEWWIDRVHPEDRDLVSRSFRDALEGRGESWVAEYKLLDAHGAWADVHNRARIARDASGKATRVVGAMLDITERKRAEEGLRQANCQLRRLSQDLLRSQDYERRRMARELHDSTAQLLTALRMNLNRLRDAELKPRRKRELLAEAIDFVTACSSEIRTVSYLLHPPLLEEAGLVSALQAYTHGFQQRTGIQIQLKIPADFGRLDSASEIALFRIVQEGLANVHRHSGSPLAVILLERDGAGVRLVLEDRGRGLPANLDTQNKGSARFGVGILGMRERADQLGGRLEITSTDAGTKLSVSLPLVNSYEEIAHIGGR